MPRSLSRVLVTTVAAAAWAASLAAQTPPAPDPAVVAFARNIEATVAKGDASALAAGMDWDAVLNKAMAGAPATPKVEADFRAGFLKGVVSFQESILKAVTGGGSYKLLRVRQVGAQPRALFRLLAGGNVNYHEFHVTRGPRGIRVGDVYVYMSGETLSESVRHGWLPMAAEANKGLVDRLAGSENEFIKTAPQWREVQRLFKAGQHKEALAGYRKLPASVQGTRMMLLTRLGITQALEEPLYLESIEAFRRAFPTDPALDLILVDGFYMKKQYDKAVESVDRLETSIGGDAHLKNVRAGLLFAKGDLEGARTWATKAVAEEPTLLDAHWTLVTVSLQQKDHAETARLLTRLESDLKVPITDLTRVPEYAAFTKSAEYRKWMGSRRK
jgi:tetratricopeptide (TPR) repeat protein